MSSQLHISNFPFDLKADQVHRVMEERFPGVVRVVPLRKGPSRPFGRMSCFVHWSSPTEVPPVELITGWLPGNFSAMGWDVPLVAKNVEHHVSRLHWAQDHFWRDEGA